MTKPQLDPSLRFKLELIAARYGIETLGYGTAKIVFNILKKNPTAEERKTLDDVAQCFGCSIKDFVVKGGK